MSLISDSAMINSTASQMAVEIIDTAVVGGYFDTLPLVCELGLECRDSVRLSSTELVTNEWVTAFENIRLELENAILRSQYHIEDGYTEAYECDAGCGPTCGELSVEYTNVVTE